MSDNTVDLSKVLIRRELLARRAALSENALERLSRAAQERMTLEPVFAKAGTVLLYAAVRDELRTDALLRYCWREGKRVLLPRCCREPGTSALNGELDLVLVEHQRQLAPGAYGIAEPEACLPDAACAVDVAVLPGVGFDRSGVRIGYGGGFYDRLLATDRLHGAVLVGLAFEAQVVERLPREPWDKPVHALCTDKEFLWI